MWGDFMEHNKKKKMYITKVHILFILMILSPVTTVFATNKDQVEQVERIPFFIVATLIGGTIIITLTYVSFKKYRAERKNKNKNKNSNS